MKMNLPSIALFFLLLVAFTLSVEANGTAYRGTLGRSAHRSGEGLSVRSSSSQFLSLFKDTTAYFDQRVDHFDPLNTKTYKQKYIVYNQNFVPGGPIFFFLGGEAPVEFFGFQEVYPRQLTKNFGALYVALEHRFYGVSNPGPDYSTDNLRLLSSRQALADAANFLNWFNSTLTKPGPWIVWGCSYSGALSAWFRAKYPNLVIGSIAPSGPVYAMNDFSAYYAQFSKVAPPACVRAVQTATNQLMSLLKTSSGRNTVGAAFNSCAPIPADAAGQYYFLLSITDALGSSDQFQNPPDYPLNKTCDLMISNPNDYLGSWAQVFASSGGGPRSTLASCNDFNEETGFLAPMRNASNSNRSWMFQQCTEFGWFSTAYPGTSVFPPVLDVKTQLLWCGKIFGVDGLTPDVDGTNRYYGGYNLRGTNILFTNGLIDPWHNLSINYRLPPPDGVSAVTYEAGHCAPMTAITNEDPVSLTNARTVINNFLQEVIANH